MRRYLIYIATAALLAGACARHEVITPPTNHEISFQAVTSVSQVRTVFNGTVFPTTESFGAFAWAEGSAGAFFMDDEVVSFDAGSNVWKAAGTYYWPKSATVDFECYYPAGMNEFTPGETQLVYAAYDVETGQEDVMYSDKAVGYTDNVDEVQNDASPESGYTGVPVIFRHALARLRVLVNLAYNHKEELDGTVTDWTITVNSASLSGIYHKGGVTLNLSDANATGTVLWTPQADANGYNVWTNDGTTTTVNGNTGAVGADFVAISDFFVLPQALSVTGQKLSLNITIKTVRNGQDFLTETLPLEAYLYLDELKAWQMNQSITYKVKIAPTAGSGNGGPVDDPDLDNVVITFDPAVDGWDSINVSTVISL